MAATYTLLYEFADGRPSFTAKNFDHRPSAEHAAAHDKAWGGYKRVTVIERTHKPCGNGNAAMLTIAR